MAGLCRRRVPMGATLALCLGLGAVSTMVVADEPRPARVPQPDPPAGRLRTLKDFRAELVYAVPREWQGSWVSMAIDPKGRLIVSDQYGKLFRVTPSPLGGSPAATRVEPIDLEIGEAHGLLWAHDSLYVLVNRGKS